MRAAELRRPSPGRGPSRAALGWIAAAAVGAAGIAGLERLRDAAPISLEVPRLDPDALLPGYGPKNFQAALAAAEAKLADKRSLLALAPDEWLRMEGVGRALLARARLTASAEDLAEAGRVLARAVDAAPWPAGPLLSRAGAALMVHDLAAAELALARFDAAVVPPSALEAEEARGMRCEIAYERGELGRARSLCGIGGGLGLSLRRANMTLAGGDASGAARIVEQALERPDHSPAQLTALMLQRAAIALATGDWVVSGKWARAATRAFPGYWLAEAFVAQQLAIEGHREDAEAAYRAIAERTGDPEVYGALAVLARERGDAAARREYLSAAGRAWAGRVGLLPRTYGGHYGEYLALAGDIPGGLKAAGEDYAARPYLQPMTDYVFVLGTAGRHARIVAVVERGERMGFRSATLMLAKSRALTALGRAGEAARARAAALRLNPRIAHPNQAFVHFRQD